MHATAEIEDLGLEPPAAELPWPAVGLMVALFALLSLGLLVVDEYQDVADWNMRTGQALGLVAGLAWLRTRRRAGSETILLALFVTWAVVSGAFVAVDEQAWAGLAPKLFRNLVLFGATVVVARERRGATALQVVLVGVALVALWKVSTTDVATYPGSLDESLVRARGFARNPNTLGFVGVWGFVATAWLWAGGIATRALRVALFSIVPALVLLVLLSGSRKSLSALAVFMLAFLAQGVLQKGREGLRRSIVGLALLVVVGLTVRHYLPDTAMGSRLERFQDDPESQLERLEMYRAAWNLFLEAPVAGVGLGNFNLRSEMGSYSHSDGAEILSNTGIVGFALYVGALVILWRRIGEARAREIPGDVAGALDVARPAMVASVAIGLGAPLFYDPSHWLNLGILVGVVERVLDGAAPRSS
jgi:putative inorganic carbon (hco3(-)) transporter